MRSPWPQLALFLVAVGLALAAGASAGPAGRGQPRSAPGSENELPVSPTPRPREGARFGAPPAPPSPDPGGGPAARDAQPAPTPPPPPQIRWMAMPVAGVDPQELPDTFADARGLRGHGAIDIPAPRGTPALAVAAGVVQKIHESLEGGHTVDVLDASGRLLYHYAHLQGYREGLHEGESVAAGEPIGYVGDSGNSVPGHTRLHFEVLVVAEEAAALTVGTGVNPLPYLRREEPLPN